ncbi:MAG: L-histidine N(alpha)-methyltransferase [Ignavibacteria bacterium]|jgi:dimethylhistidine N-methyltransferase|nr:L-histidine N(alpha)-methyltransferase [Ignavibacteria bacterium]MCU7502110.1 L-histidine N(alpha)-methyltransferase [Ignavibacteria bacterium]MCU7515512.1 L-histidine N(alpha)-methyltransferase [Ignavibacteria bacterium]
MLQNQLLKEPGLQEEILEGLLSETKRLPSKLFYDERGSKLFDLICMLDEYYLTRTEIRIMKDNIHEITSFIENPKTALIEPGSGSSIKTRLLFDNMKELPVYVPLDISEEHLLKTAETLKRNYPGLKVIPIAGDYTKDFEAFTGAVPQDFKKVLYYPGSSIGNFTHRELQHFLKIVAQFLGHGGGFLVGVDLKKDPSILHSAYNDRENITARFNLNILERLNREFGSDFEIQNFSHKAVYNHLKDRIEMYLVSSLVQTVHIAGHKIFFARGDKILTEYSYKYNPAEFERLTHECFRKESLWTDENNYFGIWYFTVR